MTPIIIIFSRFHSHQKSHSLFTSTIKEPSTTTSIPTCANELHKTQLCILQSQVCFAVVVVSTIKEQNINIPILLPCCCCLQGGCLEEEEKQHGTNVALVLMLLL